MKKRRQFIKQMLSGVMMLAVIKNKSGVLNEAKKSKEKFIVDNPYAGVIWEKFQYVSSTSHVHITNQEKFDKIYQKLQLRHIPISNYYPSVPYYPPEKILQNQFMVEQEFDVMYNKDLGIKGKEKWKNGKLKKGKLNWNKIIMDEKEGWYHMLPVEKQKQLPFKPGGPIFNNIPGDVIFSPNAEHHSFTNSNLHSNSIGSLYSSGTFDAHSEFQTLENGYCYGTGLPWQSVFKKMIDMLIFRNAGGITINHPVWSSLSFEEVCQMLDFDERVLGIEVFNDTCATGYGDPDKGWALKLWDKVLQSNRRCFGFFVPDHTVGKGKNILVVPEFTEHECLKAYRNGAFYGAIQGSGLRFTKIQLQENNLTVSINSPGQIRIITSKEAIRFSGDKPVSYDIPMDNSGMPMISYLRIEANDESSEQIYSQPIRFII